MERWHAWLGGGRQAYVTRVSGEQALAQKALDEGVKAAMARFGR
jgi:hypothetical protein